MSKSAFGGPRLPRALLDQVGDQGPRQRRPGYDRRSLHDRKNRQNENPAEWNTVGSHRTEPRPSSQRMSLLASTANKHKVGNESVNLVELDDSSRKSGRPTSEGYVSRESKVMGKKRKRGTHICSPSPEPAPKSKRELEDDAEIAALEKKLRVKGSKLPESFNAEGLGGLLGDLDDDDVVSGLGRKSREDEKWLRQKRQQSPFGDTDSDGEGMERHQDLDDHEEAGFDLQNDEALSDDWLSNSDSCLDDTTDVGSGAKRTNIKRENPYVAPVPATGAPSAEKYTPPSLRQPSVADGEATARLKRQTQGLLNRLSEANMLSILADIENLYTNNARQYVHATLVDLLVGLISDPSALNDTFLILHAGIITAIYKVVGSDFGAQLLERVVERFDHHYESDKQDESGGGKETGNLMSLLAHLYHLQMISSAIIFDYSRIFLPSISERHTELLLRIVRASGQQLRQDDATAIKDIATTLQRNVNAMSQQGRTVSIRTRFMVETINSLKDNRLKQGIAHSEMMSEHIGRMRKTLGSMNTRSLKASEPLSISLADIHNSDKRGKWWLVGASWRGPEAPTQPAQTSTEQHVNGTIDVDNAAQDIQVQDPSTTEPVSTASLIALANRNRMNTPLRRAIFTTLLSATDAYDAHTRLLKLNLTHKQQLEIPRILLHCVGAETEAAASEPEYNPFYQLVARRMCESGGKRLKMAFTYGLWDLLKRISGQKQRSTSYDDDDDDDETGSNDNRNSKRKMSNRALMHYARFYAQLLTSRSLPINMLKAIDFAKIVADKQHKKHIKDRTGLFAEVLLVATLSSLSKPKPNERERDSSAERRLQRVFADGKDVENMAHPLGMFLTKVVAQSDLMASKKERRRVKRGCEVVSALLRGDQG